MSMKESFLSTIKLVIILFVGLLVSMPVVSANSRLDSLLNVLDNVIKNESQYTLAKEKKLENLKLALPNAIKPEDKFHLYKEIFTEYEAFICDSAYQYSILCLSLAEKEKNIFWINESKLQIATTLTISGMYPESVGLLGSIEKSTLNEEQLIVYYTNYYHAYNEWGEYAEYSYAAKYKQLGRAYQDSVLFYVKPDSFEYTMEYAWRYMEQEEYDKAKKLLLAYLPKIESDTRNYAMITSITGILYWYFDDMEKHKEYLAISAIADIKAAVKENTSLRSLANVLFKEGGELERANSYIKKSMSDANFYNARLRSIQISKLYPLIENAYQLEREQQEKRLHMLLIVVSVLSVLLIITIIYIISQFRKLAEARKQTLIANEKLKGNNTALAEANHIKEEYIGRFLNLCSMYIEKMEKHHRTLNKKAKEGNLDELYKLLKSNQFIDDELKDFYNNFDSGFLNIFPNFVSQFNALLVDEEKVIPKQDEKLTTELRIFALIRLGITDSQKIAEFLRYSITTIYNYRSKYRNKSIVARDEFENEVMKISSF
ncbi:cell division protein FtsL [Dysgonomonas sp. PFB1-18]|nr:cell division protein FtsL [Dysgonomonas sp. PF1-14]MDH6340741.1 cell division protein FtsL [Dysgonomonas sp. PF1-16]MDH6382361.1 cell division protein FtsL [Dysgonomonas sp. PFB1-18]MDH6399738.1 cell division protein FtsL [Dysgonomonas sp. PF1-23]